MIFKRALAANGIIQLEVLFSPITSTLPGSKLPAYYIPVLLERKHGVVYTSWQKLFNNRTEGLVFSSV